MEHGQCEGSEIPTRRSESQTGKVKCHEISWGGRKEPHTGLGVQTKNNVCVF